METTNLSTIDWILSSFWDIPEYHLVSLLGGLLKNQSDSLDLENSNGQEKSTFVSDSRINSIIKRPCDHQLLVKSLATMDYKSVRIFLTYLYSTMECGWVLDSSNTDLLSSILKWTNALMDAHYTKFVFNSETDLVQMMLRILNEKMEIVASIQELEPLLLMIKANIKFEPGLSSSRKWRTETISFLA